MNEWWSGEIYGYCCRQGPSTTLAILPCTCPRPSPTSLSSPQLLPLWSNVFVFFLLYYYSLFFLFFFPIILAHQISFPPALPLSLSASSSISIYFLCLVYFFNLLFFSHFWILWILNHLFIYQSVPFSKTPYKLFSLFFFTSFVCVK